MRRTMLLLALAGLVLVGVVPAAGADPASRSFQAVLSGSVTIVDDTSCPTAFPYSAESAATGPARHLGMSTMTSAHCAGGTYEGEGTLFAANGDEVWYEYEGSGENPTVPDEVYEAWSDFEIVGGTGRFEGAVGEGSMEVFFLFSSPFGPWPSTFVMEGTIGY